MHFLNLLVGIATQCVALMSLPRVVHAIPLSEFYPYGTSAGDAVLPRNDDGVSSAISLGASGFRYYGTSHSDIFLSFFTCLIVQATRAFSVVAIGALVAVAILHLNSCFLQINNNGPISF